MLPLRRLALALAAFGLFNTQASAADSACAVHAAAEMAACEQQRAQVALEALTDRYSRVWATLPAERRPAFSAAERQWLNVGRWDAHAACVAAARETSQAEVVAARCLADVTAAHVAGLATAVAAQ